MCQITKEKAHITGCEQVMQAEKLCSNHPIISWVDSLDSGTLKLLKSYGVDDFAHCDYYTWSYTDWVCFIACIPANLAIKYAQYVPVELFDGARKVAYEVILEKAEERAKNPKTAKWPVCYNLGSSLEELKKRIMRRCIRLNIPGYVEVVEKMEFAYVRPLEVNALGYAQCVLMALLFDAAGVASSALGEVRRNPTMSIHYDDSTQAMHQFLLIAQAAKLVAERKAELECKAKGCRHE